ncbi:uncharacterized protein LOC144619076 [Crassostrea virginica]
MHLFSALPWVLMGSLISPLVLFFECKRLEGYKFPVYTTESCPRNETEWNERSAVFYCQGKSSYACLPNENITELLEFCYPLPRIAIHQGICLYLDKARSEVDSYDCKIFKYGCPTGPYFGSTVYIYPSCISIGNGCFLAEPSCESTTQQPKEERPEQSNKSELIWILSILGTLVLCTILFISIAIYRRKKCNNRQQTIDEENQETHQFLSHIDKEKDRDGDTDKQHTEDEKVSESHSILSVDEKETDNKGMFWSKYFV